MPQNDTISSAPRSFYCPLTMEVMVDPVIDAEGNTYERSALMQWLSHYGVSPVSRQPLHSNLVVPNFALRETIHEVMGAAWVKQRTEELQLAQPEEMEDNSEHTNADYAQASKYQTKVQCYLTKLSKDVGGGMELGLDDSGICMFSCQNMTIIVEVPEDAGFFYIFTVVTVPSLSEASKDTMLELNRLQSETRGGILSIKKHENGQYDIFFSYSDRINEISAADFCNIVPNFIETAGKLKAKFLLGEQTNKHQRPVMQTTSPESPCVGMQAKFL